MKQEVFVHHMLKARAMCEAGDRPDYWVGYRLTPEMFESCYADAFKGPATNVGMSSRRSLSGGIVSETTLSR